jgi:putative sterol carrier protein
LVEEILRDVIDRFNRKVDEDPKLAGELAGLRRTIQVDVTDGETYHFVLENSRVGPLQKGGATGPDIRISASAETFAKLYKGELRAMKALATKQIRINASFEDMLRFRRLF